MARSKLKRKREISSCDNNIRPESDFIDTYGVGAKDHLVHQENFDSEDEHYHVYEHGLSMRSYKVGGHSHYLTNYASKLNKGKTRSRKKIRRRSYKNGLSLDSLLERLLED